MWNAKVSSCIASMHHNYSFYIADVRGILIMTAPQLEITCFILPLKIRTAMNISQKNCGGTHTPRILYQY